MSIIQQPIWFAANLLGFQLSWWMLVLHGNHAIPLALSLLVLHLVFVNEKLLECRLILIVAFSGFLIDSVLTQLSFWKFSSSSLTAPMWLGVLWLSFSATLRHSLRPLWDKQVWLPLLGAFGGASSYIGASKLGAVSLGYSLLTSVLICAALWALIFPLAIMLCARSEQGAISHAP